MDEIVDEVNKQRSIVDRINDVYKNAPVVRPRNDKRNDCQEAWTVLNNGDVIVTIHDPHNKASKMQPRLIIYNGESYTRNAGKDTAPKTGKTGKIGYQMDKMDKLQAMDKYKYIEETFKD